MSAKGDAARARILDCAQALFSQKGYCAVTMQDICIASGFSRGGLYRHYASTEDIFIDLIRTEQAMAHEQLERARALNVGPERILRHFLRSRVRSLCQTVRSFDVAVSEFAANSEKGRQVLADRAKNSVAVLTELIEWGNWEGLFCCACPQSTAAHILWMIEGMSRHSCLLPITEEDIQQQLTLIGKLLGHSQADTTGDSLR